MVLSLRFFRALKNFPVDAPRTPVGNEAGAPTTHGVARLIWGYREWKELVETSPNHPSRHHRVGSVREARQAMKTAGIRGFQRDQHIEIRRV